MGFIDLYKRIEKICNEIYDDKSGISRYIEEMEQKTSGSLHVSGWNATLKRLKHCRWIRNKIVHDPGCTEENMCKADDVEWLQGFYSQIMSYNDPLALYRKVTPTQHKHTTIKKRPNKSNTVVTLLAIGAVVVAFVALWWVIIKLMAN